MASATETLLPSDDAAAAAEPRGDEMAEPGPGRRRFILLQVAPAWVISTFVHVLVLLLLGLVTLADPARVVNVLSASSTAEDGPEIEEFAIEEVDPGDVAEMEDFSETPVELEEPSEVEPVPVELPTDMATVPIEMSDLAAELAPSSSTLQTLASAQTSAVSSRAGDMKKQLLREYGGNASSEAAVTEALKWLARHQMPNGAWTYQHPLVCRGRCGDPGDPKFARSHIAATSMALLPFLGAGQTHYGGEFKETVRRGLLFLVNSGKPGKQAGLPVLDLTEGAGNMYSHGLAAITLCEAYAMTEDPALAGPAQASLNFIVYAQCRDGGWRYQPQQPDGGDTSVTGWQVMALKSGYMGHLTVPPSTVQGSILFLDKVQSDGGSIYGYNKPVTKPRPACTAIGLLCRMYTGWDKTHDGIIRGVGHLSKIGVKKKDIYYNYYAAQVLRHFGGAEWEKFNAELRDWLVQSQAQSGGAKGSWHFPESQTHRGPKEGGRLASTSFATMILEVYYRHMPLYADSAADEEFPL